MTPTQGETALSPTFKAVLYGIALTALARASLVLAVCIIMDAFGGQGLGTESADSGPRLRPPWRSRACRGLRAERASEFDPASGFYALALVNYFICYAALLAGSFLKPGGN